MARGRLHPLGAPRLRGGRPAAADRSGARGEQAGAGDGHQETCRVRGRRWRWRRRWGKEELDVGGCVDDQGAAIEEVVARARRLPEPDGPEDDERPGSEERRARGWAVDSGRLAREGERALDGQLLRPFVRRIVTERGGDGGRGVP